MSAITTEYGTTVRLSKEEGGTYILLELPDAPPSRQHILAGVVLEGGFHPWPEAPVIMAPSCLRAIADLLDEVRP